MGQRTMRARRAKISPRAKASPIAAVAALERRHAGPVPVRDLEAAMLGGMWRRLRFRQSARVAALDGLAAEARRGATALRRTDAGGSASSSPLLARFQERLRCYRDRGRGAYETMRAPVERGG